MEKLIRSIHVSAFFFSGRIHGQGRVPAISLALQIKTRSDIFDRQDMMLEALQAKWIVSKILTGLSAMTSLLRSYKVTPRRKRKGLFLAAISVSVHH